ncbi:MAG: hypothetical protein VX766_07260 [Pseudomonadota bacterium]|nr:hypothetical protein [Pseudomonadota bacterium]
MSHSFTGADAQVVRTASLTLTADWEPSAPGEQLTLFEAQGGAGERARSTLTRRCGRGRARARPGTRHGPPHT